MSTARILLVEDEPSLQLTLSDRLESEGYEIECAGDGELGLRRALEESWDLLILDLNLPKKNGMDVCRDLRQQGKSTPVLMLTARGQVVDKIVGLKLGADDYMTKPFEMLELLARVEALLRRARSTVEGGGGGETYTFGEIRIDFERSEVHRGGTALELSALEWNLLSFFIRNRGKVLSRDLLLDEVWGYDAMPQTRTVDVHVGGLRQKIEPVPGRPRYLMTVHGRGYKFVG